MTVQSTYSDNPAVAYAGMIGTGGPEPTFRTMRNNEATAEMPFGVAVVFEESTDDQGALLPDAITELVAGIVVHSHAYAKDEQLGDDGVKPTNMISVMTSGRIWVQVEEAVAPGDRGHIRAVATGGEQEGAFRASADSTDTIDSTNQVLFLTSAAIDGLALAQVNFNVSPSIVDPS
jgi:hypothetical protein